MKKIEAAGRIILLFVSIMIPLSGRLTASSAAGSAFAADTAKTKSVNADTAKEAGNFSNPFNQGGSAAVPAQDSTMKNATTGLDLQKSSMKVMTSPKKTSVDVLLDLSLGVDLSRFDVKSTLYSSAGDFDVLFNMGFIIPIYEKFFFELAVRDMRLQFSTSGYISDGQGSSFSSTAGESMNFISLAPSVGMKFEFGSFRPYFYATCEPAYLTSSAELMKSTSTTLFLPDSVKYAVSSSEDKATTSNRARFQVFAGGGIGLEADYGYGYVYLNCGAEIALIQTGYRDFSPSQASSTLIVFPISLGVRFYL